MSDLRRPAPEDICSHGGEDYRQYYGAMSPPIFQTSLFVQHDGSDSPYVYTRVDNPTTRVCEEKLALLEHAERALLFASGMGAISAAISACVRAGDHVILMRNSYNPTKGFASYLEKYGISHTLIHGVSLSDFEEALRAETSLVYLESPSSFLFDLQDIRQVSELCRARGVRTVIDNTWATPLYQNPLDLGVDLVVHSASKYLSGHSDLVGGVVAGRRELTDDIANYERQLYGGIMDPHQAWLLMRGLRTLPLRMRRHTENAMRVAEFLEGHPRVARVFYPGLPSHGQYSLAQKQMSGASGVMSFITTGTSEQALRMLSRVRIFQKGVSWGGYDSLISGPGVCLTEEQSRETFMPVGLIRISVGLEHIDTLLEDLDSALKEIS